jgi:hypothetical protein
MNYCEENTETCKFIELNGCKLCCFTNGHIYRVMANGNMEYCNNTNKNEYMRLSCKYKKYLHHRIIGYAFLGLDIENTLLEIDHINHIRYDNRVDNLRIVTPQENKFNNSGKGYRVRGNKWQARIRFNCKDIHLGYFKTEEEARNAYLEGKAKYHIIPNNN